MMAIRYPANWEKILDAFFTRAATNGRTGISLWIVRAVITSLCGMIRLVETKGLILVAVSRCLLGPILRPAR